MRLTTENGNLQAELQRHHQTMADFRLQFESKLEVVARLQSESNMCKTRMSAVNTLIKTYLNDGRIGEETRDKLSNLIAVLEGVEYKRNPNSGMTMASPGRCLDTISEADTTGKT